MIIGEGGVEGFVQRKKAGLKGGLHGVLLIVSMEELVRGRGSEVTEAALIRDLRDGVRRESTGVV